MKKTTVDYDLTLLKIQKCIQDKKQTTKKRNKETNKQVQKNKCPIMHFSSKNH